MMEGEGGRWLGQPATDAVCCGGDMFMPWATYERNSKAGVRQCAYSQTYTRTEPRMLTLYSCLKRPDEVT